MLGKSLTAKRFKEMEKLTWEKFQTQMGVFKEDYKKQQQDHAKGMALFFNSANYLMPLMQFVTT